VERCQLKSLRICPMKVLAQETRGVKAC
jgi:hypothetical protein